MQSPAFANGHQLGTMFDVEGSARKFSCNPWPNSNYLVEEECFGLNVPLSNELGRDPYLTHHNCTEKFASKAICKRNSLQTSSNLDDSPIEKYTDWIVLKSSTATNYYKFFSLDSACPSRTNWYCARLLCQDFNSKLAWIETEEEYTFLINQVYEYNEHNKNENITDYFIDLHRLFNNLNIWTYENPNPSKHVTLSSDTTDGNDICEPRLCGRIYCNGDITATSKLPFYCNGLRKSRAICKISKSNVNQKINRETTIHWYDGAIGIALLVAIIILSITIIILLIICVCNNYLKKRKTNSESSYQMESSSSYPNRPVPPRPGI